MIGNGISFCVNLVFHSFKTFFEVQYAKAVAKIVCSGFPGKSPVVLEVSYPTCVKQSLILVFNELWFVDTTYRIVELLLI